MEHTMRVEYEFSACVYFIFENYTFFPSDDLLPPIARRDTLLCVRHTSQYSLLEQTRFIHLSLSLSFSLSLGRNGMK